jgi:hypothetical protein
MQVSLQSIQYIYSKGIISLKIAKILLLTPSVHLLNSFDAEIRSTGNLRLFKRYLNKSVKGQKLVNFDQLLSELPISKKRKKPAASSCVQNSDEINQN